MKNIEKRYRRPYYIGVNLSIVFLCLFMLSFISADKIIQSSTTGIIVEFPKFDVLPENEAATLNIHAFNASNGLILTNETTTCEVYAYYQDGTHAVSTILFYDMDSKDFYLDIPKEAFIKGYGSYTVYCNTTNMGGFASIPIEITPTGFAADLSEALFYLLLVLFILLFLTISIIFAIKTPFGNDRIINKDGSITVKKVTLWKYLKLFFISFSYGMFMWMITIITAITVNYIHYDKLVNITKSLYLVVNGIGYLGGFIMAIVVFILIWRDIILNQDIIKFGESIISGDIK